MKRLIFENSKLFVEDISQELVFENKQLTTVDSDYVGFDGANVGDVIRIKSNDGTLDGVYYITEYNGDLKLSSPVIVGLDSMSTSGFNVQIAVVPMTNFSCYLENETLEVGSWQFTEDKTACGTKQIPAGFQRGSVSLTFKEDWEHEVQNAILMQHQTKSVSLAIIVQPQYRDVDSNESALLPKIEFTSGTIESLSYNRQDVYSGTLNIKINSNIYRIRTA